MTYYVERSAFRPRALSATSAALRVCVGLLVIDAIIEMAFASSTTAWLDHTASHTAFRFVANGRKHPLSGHPRHFIVDQVHTSNAAAVAALIIVGFGSAVSLRLRDWAQHRKGQLAKGCRYFYYLWLSFNVPAVLLTGVALIYVFAVTNTRTTQKISTALAVNENSRPYSRGTWTPQSWFAAVLRLELVRGKEDIVKQLVVMQGWQYNLVPMFVLQLSETVLAFMDYNRWIREPRLPEAYSGF
ncbi:hypothetical protein F5Y10DRAFT_76648 [Nemania abortiva]|nr:hypothetical protein F5Y10DRAFT_76648 [Nemania abortiva]